MTKLELIELIALIVLGVGLGIYYIYKAIKNNWLKKLTNAIKEGIAEAEKTNASGDAKKAYVMSHVQLVCDKEGIPFELIKKLVDKTIEKFIEGYNTIAKSK